MMQVFQVREEKRKLIPAVTHVDGSGRLQTVTSSTNPRYHKLIESFRDLTGIPMVLNTSFNENEPVVCKPEEALDCFLRTKMDKLVLGNVVIARRGSAAIDFKPQGKPPDSMHAIIPSYWIQFNPHAFPSRLGQGHCCDTDRVLAILTSPNVRAVASIPMATNDTVQRRKHES
jgi:hypothetical protein